MLIITTRRLAVTGVPGDFADFQKISWRSSPERPISA